MIACSCGEIDMAAEDHDWNRVPWWCWAAPLLAAALVAAKLTHLVEPDGLVFVVLAVALLGGAVFAAVHHAEVLAVRIGEPFGSILLALAITTLEAGLIISVMASGASGSDVVARDTVFSVVMIVLNGIVGLCLVIGGARHFEQEFRVQGAAGILSVIATLAIVALVLPNFTLTAAGPVYAPSQLLFVGAVSLLLYVVFVFVQTVRHRDDFVIEDGTASHGEPPGNRSVLISSLLLIVSLVVVIFLAKSLSPLLGAAVLKANLPLSIVGVIIAMIVLLPEGLTAMKAARRNRLQTSLNASLGSALASIGLTIPIAAVASVLLGVPLVLGLDGESMVLLTLTLFVASLTLSTGRTTVLQGAVHLVIFCVFVFLSAIP
jgi:Ca2+:H+ antiporter